ncbi:hypothetical protein FRC05_003376 [Tulasnella sp. 425]|nr:hypothetical protein FRC05_003376 [Tulasnella sp. 425]
MSHLPDDLTPMQPTSEDLAPSPGVQTRTNTIDLFLPLLADPPSHASKNDGAAGLAEKKSKAFAASIVRSDSSSVFAVASGSEWGDDLAKELVDSPASSPRLLSEMYPNHPEAKARKTCETETDKSSRLPQGISAIVSNALSDATD